MQSAHELALAIRMAYLSMHRQTDAFLSSFEITADQFVLLGVLTQQDGITQQEVSRRAASDPNTVRAMLLLMEQKDLIQRAPHGRDRRALAITLTKKGRRLYAEAWKQIQPLHATLEAPFQPREIETLIASLGRIAEAMASRPDNRDADRDTIETVSKHLKTT